jgi:hypothetical protein
MGKHVKLGGRTYRRLGKRRQLFTAIIFNCKEGQEYCQLLLSYKLCQSLCFIRNFGLKRVVEQQLAVATKRNETKAAPTLCLLVYRSHATLSKLIAL